MQRIAFQGEEESSSHEAVLWCFGEQVTLVPCATFAEVMFRVARGTVDVAVVPIGNSFAGPELEVCRLLTQTTQLSVAGAYQWPIRHCLLCLPGQHLQDLTQVLSHPHVLAQCDAFLREHGLTPVAAPDAAGSARRIRERGLRGVAAIASARVADRYRLAILTEDIQTCANNRTCFAVLRPAQVGSREDYTLLCQLKAARAAGQHDQAERLTRAWSRSLRAANGTRLPARTIPSAGY